MVKSFARYAKYYDLLYKDKDYATEVDYVHKLLMEFDHTNKNVLEFGSGTGIHGLAISQSGRFVQGVEISPEMASQIVESENFKVVVGDIGTTVINRRFGTVISLFHVISYMASREKQLEVFRNANRHLELDGHFIFDVWYSPAVQAQVPEVRVKRMHNDQIEVIRLAEPKIFGKDNNVEVNYTIFIREMTSSSFEAIVESHMLHHFSEEEILNLANDCGFKLVNFHEFLTGQKAGEDTWGVTFVLKKIVEV